MPYSAAQPDKMPIAQGFDQIKTAYEESRGAKEWFIHAVAGDCKVVHVIPVRGKLVATIHGRKAGCDTGAVIDRVVIGKIE